MRLVPKLVALAVASVALVSSAVAYFTLSATHHSMSTLVTHQLLGNVSLGISKIEADNDQLNRFLKVASRNRTIRKALVRDEFRGVNQLLNELIRVFPFVNFIALVTPDGTIQAVSTRDYRGQKIAGEQLLLDDARTNPMFVVAPLGEIGVGTPGVDPYLSRIGLGRDRTQWLTADVTKRGVSIGMVLVSFDWDAEFGATLDEVRAELSSEHGHIDSVLLADDEGLIFHLSRAEDRQNSGAGFPSGERFAPDPSALYVSKPVQFGDLRLNLVIVSDREAVLGPLVETTKKLSFMAVVGAALLIALLYGVLRQLLVRRIGTLSRGAEILGQGDFTYRLPALGPDELGDLARSYNLMAENIEGTTTSRDSLDREVDERKLIEVQLKHVLESVPSGLVLIAPDGTIEMINAATETLFGYSRGELVGQSSDLLLGEHWRDVLTSPLSVPSKLRGYSGYQRNKARRKEGSECEVEIALSPLSDGDGRLLALPVTHI